MRRHFKILIICIGLILSLLHTEAQFYNGYNLTFGKNRIQYENRVWNYYRTPIVDIYYYSQGKELAQSAAQKMQSIITQMEQKIGVSLERKIQLIIYARQSDFMQSNIGLQNDQFYNIGGVTQVYGDKIILFFDGNSGHFFEALQAGVAGLFVNYLTFGSGLAAEITSSYRSDIPQWFTGGATAFLSKKWTQTQQSQLKNSFIAKKYKKLYKLSFEEQQLAGFSFWNYVSKTYGETAVPMILYYTGISKNYEKGFLYAIGTDFRDIFEAWLSACENEFAVNHGDTKTIGADLVKYKKRTHYIEPKISPDGTTLAYITNKEGKVKIFLQNLETKKRQCIYSQHYSIEDRPDYSSPLIEWHPLGEQLTMCIEWHDKVYLKNYTLKTKKWSQRQVIFINKVVDFSYDLAGKRMAMSCVNHGQSDIYIYNLASRSLIQITNDKADDCGAVFVYGDKMLAFSSNRTNDTLGKEKDDYLDNNMDLFLYDVEKESKNLTKITKTPQANESGICNAGENKIMYISKDNHKIVRYLGEFQSVISHIDTSVHYDFRLVTQPVEKYTDVDIEQQNLSTDGQTIYEQVFKNGRWLLATQNLKEESDNEFIEITQNADIQLDVSIPKDSLSLDSTRAVKIKRLRQVRMSEVFGNQKDTSLNADKKENNLPVFENNSASADTLVLLQRGYQVQYFISELVAQADFGFLNDAYQQYVRSTSPIYLNAGLNAFAMVGIRDLLEDFRMSAGGRLSVDLGDIECFYSFENLKQRLDRQVFIFYRTQKYTFSQTDIRQQTATVYYRLKYPFDRINSLLTTFALRYNQTDYRSASDLNVLKHTAERSFWTYIKEEYTIDASKQLDVNMLKGFRGKIFAEFYFTPDKKFENMLVYGFDFRHYTQLDKTLIWANRLAGSGSLGKNRLIYYMGGVDNWIFAKFNSETSVDTTINYSYQTLATNMRGFEQNIRNGNNFVVLNSELRWQIFQSLFARPLRSEFLRTFQLVAFGDVGTAWNGWSPYDPDNALYTRTVTQGDLTISFRREIEPIVAGFGIGARFMLFSYFIRLDYAWGVSNYKINKGVFYLSLNLDF
ncbi:MAG: hypothetical protein LBR36_08990 [Bacteroidales bacterium]|jgi:hypothetical protein|nr:hypothetical protein [Bacteroidales bacterium]